MTTRMEGGDDSSPSHTIPPSPSLRLHPPPLPLSPAGGPMVGGEGIMDLDDDLLIRLWPADRVLVRIIFLCMVYVRRGR